MTILEGVSACDPPFFRSFETLSGQENGHFRGRWRVRTLSFFALFGHFLDKKMTILEGISACDPPFFALSGPDNGNTSGRLRAVKLCSRHEKP